METQGLLWDVVVFGKTTSAGQMKSEHETHTTKIIQ